MTAIASILSEILKFFHDTLSVSWGWAIILLTLLIKLLLFPTTISQLRSMEGIKKIQPVLKEIQEKYKKNPEELQRKTMEVYKEHKVNPLGGCLPLLIQLPFLWALFLLLNNPEKFQIDFVNATFLGMNLSADRNLVLAVLSGITTFLQQKVSTPGGTEPSQNTFLYVMPFILGYITYSLKAGVGLYWVSSNVIGIAQQVIISRYIFPKENMKNGAPGQGIPKEKEKKVKKE